MNTATFKSGNNYIINEQNSHRIGVIVSNAGIAANANGRKIIPNGTPIGGATSAMENRQTVLSVVADATVQGLLWEPTGEGLDVTNGNTNATMFVFGVADTKQLPATVTSTIKTALAKQIYFQEGR